MLRGGSHSKHSSNGSNNMVYSKETVSQKPCIMYGLDTKSLQTHAEIEKSAKTTQTQTQTQALINIWFLQLLCCAFHIFLFLYPYSFGAISTHAKLKQPTPFELNGWLSALEIYVEHMPHSSAIFVFIFDNCACPCHWWIINRWNHLYFYGAVS